MIVRFEPHSSTHSRIYDSDTGDTLEIVPLAELRPKLLRWREHARAVNADHFLDTPHQPVTVTYRQYRRRP